MNCAPGIAKELQNCIALKFLRLLDVGNCILVVKCMLFCIWLYGLVIGQLEVLVHTGLVGLADLCSSRDVEQWSLL